MELACASMDLGYAVEHIQESSYSHAIPWIEMAIKSVDSVLRRTK